MIELSMLEQSAERYRVAGDDDGHARVLAQIGRTHYQRGSPEAGIKSLLSFLESAGNRRRESVSPTGLAELYAALALLFFAVGKYEEQLRAAERAGEMARTASDERLFARVEVNRALALLALKQRDAAQRILEAVLPLSEAAGDLDNLARAGQPRERPLLSRRVRSEPAISGARPGGRGANG